MSQEQKSFNPKHTVKALSTIPLTAQSTKRDGDCALHALFGEWDAKEQQFICPDVSQRREQMARAIKESKTGSRVHTLAIAGIKELIMTGRATGKESQRLLVAYQQFLADQNALSSQLWQTFEIILRAHPDIVNYIAEHHEHPKGATASLREQFYDALNRHDGELSAILRSLTILNAAFEQYNELAQTAYDWPTISDKVLAEYAQFVGKPGQWLLPSEVALLAEIFQITVTYYAISGAVPETLNPQQSTTVSIQFNGRDHFERMTTTPAAAVRLKKHEQASIDSSLPASTGQTNPAALMTDEQIASLMASADCLHPESPSGGATTPLSSAISVTTLTPSEFDHLDPEQLLTRLQAGDLSLAARYRLANSCYRHWQRQLTTVNAAAIARLAVQLQSTAQGRTLFRRPGEPTRYYWGSSTAVANSTRENGWFFRCYPTFEAGQSQQGQGTTTLYQAKEVVDPHHVEICKDYTELQRQQHALEKLSAALGEKLQSHHADHTPLIFYLQRAWWYYRSNASLHPLPLSVATQIVFYFQQAMGRIARHRFTQQKPTLPASLLSAAQQLQQAIDRVLITQAQRTLFVSPSAALLASWSLCEQKPTLKRIYQLTQQTAALLAHAVNVPMPARQPLINAWLAGFNSRPGGDDLYVRAAITTAVTAACNPMLKDVPALDTVHQWLKQIMQHLQQYAQTPRANALKAFYQQLLSDRQSYLKNNMASAVEPRKTLYASALHACQWALTDLAQGFGVETTATVEAKATSLPVSSANAFTERDQRLQDWHQTLTEALQAGKSVHEIQAENTTFARDLVADICREIECQIGPAPYAYTLLGAGSFSRGEISPASDLDCALLVANVAARKHPWFQWFLQLLPWKLASLPTNVLAIESKTLAWMEVGYWFDTPEGLIKQHLTSQQPNNPMSRQQAENFGAQWLRWIYSSRDQPQEKDALFRDYQQRLQTFFQNPIGTSPQPAYQQLAPWSLKQHLGESFIPTPRALVIAPPPAPENRLDAKESKHEVKANSSESSTNTTFTVLNVKRLSYRLINAILCYGRFNDVPSGITATCDVLAYLKQHQCLPASFIARLETALGQLYTWRLRQHWAWLHHASELGENNEVVLWPEDAAQQAAIQALSSEQRGFYLDKTETQQCQIILNTVAEVIGRSVEGFAMLEALVPFVGARHAVPVQDDPISPSSSHTTTSAPEVKETKESKREVSEAEAQAIVAAQSRAVLETKSAAPSSVAHVFNPLAAAVEWTLQQLAKPKDDKSSTLPKSNPRDLIAGSNVDVNPAVFAAGIQVRSVEQAHIRWLAQVMGHCAEELPASEPHSNDPIRVKQDAEFRKHWQVYWTIPTAWRDMYIKQLRQSLTTKSDTLIESLIHAPNNVGWRLSTQLGEQQWQQALRPLFAAEPQASLPPEAKTDITQGKAIWVSWVDQNTLRWAPLRQECAAVLIDAKQQRWQPQNNVHGNHRLYALQTPSHSFWVKAYPEQPGTEYLVTALDRRLGVNGTPAQQLMALHHAPLRIADGTPQGMLVQQSAILLSQHVADAKYTLHRRIKKEPQFLEKLDFLAFAKTLLRVLLTNPEDDKGSDYFLVPLAGSDKYQLIRIDNERAFLPVTHLTQSTWSNQEDLQVKSILYCLDQMLLPWSGDARTAQLLDDLHQVQPSALIIDLLQDIEQQHAHWQQLFSESVISQHASLQDPWMSIPTFMLPQGLESALLKRLTSLQTALRLLKPQAITGLKLLELVQPKLARYYNQAHIPRI